MPDIYGTVEGFAAYHEERGTTLPASASDPDQVTAALVVASEWIDARYRTSFGGLKVGGRDQEREWPRTGANDAYGYALPSDVAPREVINATYEVAAKHLASPGVLAIDYAPSKYKSVSVSGAVSAQFADYSSSAEFQRKFAIVEQIIAPVLTSRNGGVFSGLSGSVARV